MAKRKFKGFKGHGNEKRNPNPHHLYEIKDKVDDSVYKYGISSDPIDENNSSYRMRRQVNIGNSFVGWLRFFGRIIMKNIQGRERAEDIEREHIDEYEITTGKKPRGNMD